MNTSGSFQQKIDMSNEGSKLRYARAKQQTSCIHPLAHFQSTRLWGGQILEVCSAMSFGDTAVAAMITELIRFEPKICICNGNQLEFKSESVSVMRDLLLLTFPQIGFCNGNELVWQHESASVIANSCPPEKVSVCNQCGCYGIPFTGSQTGCRSAWLCTQQVERMNKSEISLAFAYQSRAGFNKGKANLGKTIR